MDPSLGDRAIDWILCCNGQSLLDGRRNDGVRSQLASRHFHSASCPSYRPVVPPQSRATKVGAGQTESRGGYGLAKR
ncbi:hypothetical protein CRE_01128 [Caenorhabditis remanei]|uniref:Uncharacterized protein n=1 Tax=Caenorhabditis remanei TaxID=31234 RepID=E3MWL0_CAERE|nr:hypothetical protein CRE_01128 [Caenorhabditis remanei]